MITIQDKEYKLKYTLRALFVYEKIAGKAFKFEGLYSEYLLLYCILIANNENFELSFDEFIDICDENPKVFNHFRDWLIKELEKQSKYQSEESEDASPDCFSSRKERPALRAWSFLPSAEIQSFLSAPFQSGKSGPLPAWQYWFFRFPGEGVHWEKSASDLQMPAVL